jgi:hypothetical protein
MALAHYRRAMALKFLNKLDLSVVDLQFALKYQPDDNTILEEIVEAHFRSNEIETKNVAEISQEELLDFAEQCLVEQPRPTFTLEKITELSKKNESAIFQEQKQRISMERYRPNGMMDMSSLLGNAGGLLGNLPFGLSPETIQDAQEIFTAVMKVYRRVHRSIRWVVQNRDKLLIAFSVISLFFVVNRYHGVINLISQALAKSPFFK